MARLFDFPWNRTARELEAVRAELAEVRAQQEGPSAEEVEALRAEAAGLREKIEDLEGNPVVAFVRQVESQVPGLGKVPRWLVALLLTGAVGSLASFTVLAWHTVLLRSQVEESKRQNAQIREQLDSQAADTRIVRRAQLLNTIYELSDCDTSKLEEGEEQCPPKASPRLRAEAVLALYQLDGNDTNLSGANLGGVNLILADLRGADLRGVNFRGASLVGVNFRGAYFDHANLSDANLRGVNFRGASLVDANLLDANLFGVNLSGVNLRGANLSGASLREADLTDANLRDSYLSGTDLSGTDLSGTDLSGADLTGARALTKEQLTETCGDAETVLPDELPRPSHYLDQPFDPATDPRDAGCPPRD